ncbi:MAG: acyl-CoA desaturase [Flavobacteriales bacterium]|nr:acyl-CoA desaturase [Flavobacteriales bacterium]
MNLKHCQFPVKDVEFYSVLRKRVNAYFKNNNISKHANMSMILKTIFVFSLFFIPYAVLLISNNLTSSTVFLLSAIMGFGMTGIGLGIMHDANHGAYSSNKTINKILGLSLNMIGANAEIWKIQHNRLHHTYTNIEGADHDLATPFFLRLSPTQKKLRMHRFQYIYAWFFYCFSTLARVLVKEFVQITQFKSIGLISNRSFFQLIGWKLFYLITMIIIPLYFIQAPMWAIITSFLMMHLINGLLMSAIFQVAHIMPSCTFPEASEENQLQDSWVRHEMKTTTNFSPKSKVFTWLVGGLNYQVEHHLFPQVCHVHYPDISHIVSNTAYEYGLPYNSEKTFMGAIGNHIKMLHKLGND